MRLKQLLAALNSRFDISEDVEIRNICANSKDVKKGDLFIASKGEKLDGYNFINEAINRGARAIISHKDFFEPKDVIKIIIKDIDKKLSNLATAFFDNPSQKLKVIGITGTNGKTTVSYIIYEILKEANFSVGLIGSIQYRIGSRVVPAINTTPGCIELQKHLSSMVNEKVDYVVMEVSSHSLKQERVKNIKFSSAIFTNLTQDHLDYHKTIDDYFESKVKLFTQVKEDAKAIVNIDDKYGRVLLERISCEAVKVAIEKDADYKVAKFDIGQSGSKFTLSCPFGDLDINTRLIGVHNIYNIITAVATILTLGIDKRYILPAIEKLQSVKGRLDEVSCGQNFRVFVDYAHTDDSLKNVLSTLRSLVKGRLIVVFGCGGDRDKGKRPLMGKVASQYGDYVIITNDNPRGEDPEQIASQIISGFSDSYKDYLVVLDRYEAIKKALESAASNDIVIIAGKGHESYQIMQNKVIDFDDKEVARRLLQNKKFIKVS